MLINNKKIFNISNPWFIIPVIITSLLLIILTWNLIHSYQLIKEFENKELVLQKTAGELLFHAKSLEMAIFMATYTGDLRWKDNYKDHKPKLREIIKRIDNLSKVEKVTKEINKIRNHRAVITKIEDKAFRLISKGDKKRAERILKGWTYTKHQLGIRESTKKLEDALAKEVREKIILERKILFLLLIVVSFFFIILIISAYISIKQWFENLKSRQEREERLNFLSYHDSLTGLYNRRYFMKEAKEEVNKTADNESLALVRIDIDNFKVVNDNFGYDIGDKVLEKSATRLENSIKDETIISRIGGDEFIIVVTDISTKKEIKKIVNKIIDCFNKPLLIKESKLFISVSMGISIYPRDGKDLKELVKNSDSALYRAKKEQRDYVFSQND